MTINDILNSGLSDSQIVSMMRIFQDGGSVKVLKPTDTITVGDKEFDVEIADTDEKRSDGLSRCRNLKDDQGMLFVFDSPSTNYFTMKETDIDLDIVFIDDEDTVISVESVEARDPEPIVCNKPYKYVLEVCIDSDIQPGDEVEFEDDEYTEDEKKEMATHSKMLVLDSNGNVQMKLEGGERIVSMIKTRQLIKAALKAYKSDDDADYARVGKLIFKELDAQDGRDPQYVEKNAGGGHVSYVEAKKAKDHADNRLKDSDLATFEYNAPTVTATAPSQTTTTNYWDQPMYSETPGVHATVNPTVASPEGAVNQNLLSLLTRDFSKFAIHSDISGDDYVLTNKSHHACTTGPKGWWNKYLAETDEGRAAGIKPINFWNRLDDSDSDLLHDEDWETVFHGYGADGNNYTDLKPGDIAISFAYDNNGKKTKHAAMWTGNDWRSDFIQKHAWVYGNPKGRNGDHSFIILRNKKLNGVQAAKQGAKIHIKESNKGKFTDYCGGKVTEECIEKGKHSASAAVRKRANFAANARTWKHESGGSVGYVENKKADKKEDIKLNESDLLIDSDTKPSVQYTISDPASSTNYWTDEWDKLTDVPTVVASESNPTVAAPVRTNTSTKYSSWQDFRDKMVAYLMGKGLSKNAAMWRAAQMGAETGHGTNSGSSVFNFGNITKGSNWTGRTTRFGDNPLDFRVYNSFEEGIDDYLRLLGTYGITNEDEGEAFISKLTHGPRKWGTDSDLMRRVYNMYIR